MSNIEDSSDPWEIAILQNHPCLLLNASFSQMQWLPRDLSKPGTSVHAVDCYSPIPSHLNVILVHQQSHVSLSMKLTILPDGYLVITI